jgi:hypothetical protein
MKRWLLFLLLVLAACGAPPPPIPTVALLPTLAATPIPPTVTPNLIAQVTTAPTETPNPTATATPTATAPMPTLTPTRAPTLTGTSAPTVTPSLTITNTVTRPPTATFTATIELSGMGMLADLVGRTTVLPPEQLYNDPTLTAFAVAAQTYVAGSGGTLTPAVGGTPAGTLALTPTNCAVSLPSTLGTLFAADSSLQARIGCPQASAGTATASAAQVFENGSMIYLGGSPGTIYVLTTDGRFRRFADTFVEGSDPEGMGEIPPPGRIEPIRGFGKVWRSNPDVRAALGWAVTGEDGGTATLLLFDHGRAVFLPQRGETYLLIDDADGQTGMWRANSGAF